MNGLLMIIFLTVIWCGFSNKFSIFMIITGLIFSSLCHGFFYRYYHDMPVRLRFWPFLLLIMYTLWQLIKSSVLVAWEILTPWPQSHPSIIEVPMDCKTDIQKMILTNLISLTPGTLFIHTTAEDTLIIHSMFTRDPEEVINFFKEQLEPKVMRAFFYDGN